MYIFIQHIIDFIFPPSKEELRLRLILPEVFGDFADKSVQTEYPFIKAIFSYKDPLVKELIWQIKYKKNKHALRCAGYALYNELKKNLRENSMDSIILIPIPISKRRRRERGYNQCELIINEIEQFDMEKRFTKDFGLLIRTKHIERQTLKNREERIHNTEHIFNTSRLPSSEDERNAIIIIIDDVTTTGSTLLEARKSLIQSGYNNVTAITIAH